jgi:SAM-dependent methyltransferase
VVGVSAAVTWHDVENGAYDADLPLWRELAAAADGPVLDLGAGTGRVAIDLAARGLEVVALDSDPELLAALAERDRRVTTVAADARDFHLRRSFALVIAPMQLMQILGGANGRLGLLRSAHSHLRAGGVFAAALAEATDAVPDGAASPPLPDILERDGWVFSSQPVSVQERNGCVVVTRRRHAVSPSGELEDQSVEVALDLVGVDAFEREARRAGFTQPERRAIAETPDHIGSTVILCRR